MGRVSRAAGRAGRLAIAYNTGNREALREAGLNYDELRALGDPVAVGIKIIEAAFESQADSTVADAEERDIVASCRGMDPGASGRPRGPPQKRLSGSQSR